MRIIKCEKLENCFDGEFVFMYHFDTTWTRKMILKMKVLGEFKYYESFPKPMFQVNMKDCTILKGVQGECSMRVIFPRKCIESAKTDLEQSLGDIGINGLN